MMKINKVLGMALMVSVGAVLATGAEYRPLPEQTKAALGASHVLILKSSDLTNSVVSGIDTYTGVSIPAKHGVECVAAVLKTAFSDGSTNITSATVQVGDGTDADLFLNAMEVESTATEEFFKWGNQSFNSASTSITAFTNATVAITPQAPGAQTPTITVTAQRPGAQTPTITVTKETGAVTASGANNLVTPTATVTAQRPGAQTPTITVTKETAAVTAAGANNLVTPTATVTAQRPGAQTPTITVTVLTTAGYDATGAAITNAAGEVIGIVTSVTATCSALLDYMTNATCAITPDLASNAVVAVAVTGGGAVMTNATAASSALLDYPTNATATCSALPDFATNATAAVSGQTDTALKTYTVTQGQNVYTTSTPLKVTITPTGVSALTSLTEGEIWIYLKDIDQPTFGN